MQKRILLISILVLIVIASVTCYLIRTSHPKIVYVDSNKLFTDFKMTKELKVSGEKVLNFKNKQIDSLQFLLSVVKDQSSRSLLMQQFISEKQSVEEFQKDFAQSNSQKIWDRIASYADDFGKIKGYDFIIGSNGKEQLLYGNMENDVTVLLLNFINKKYEGFR